MLGTQGPGEYVTYLSADCQLKLKNSNFLLELEASWTTESVGHNELCRGGQVQIAYQARCKSEVA
jgi:hypothetical protein